MAIGDIGQRLNAIFQNPETRLMMTNYAAALTDPRSGNLGRAAALGAQNYQTDLQEYKRKALENKLGEAQLSGIERKRKYEDQMRKDQQQMVGELIPSLQQSNPQAAALLQSPQMQFAMKYSQPRDVASIMQSLLPGARTQGYYGSQILENPETGETMMGQFSRSGGFVPTQNVPEGYQPVAGYLPDVAGRRKYAETTGKMSAEKYMRMPESLAKTEYTIDVIDELLQHPGLKYAVGAEGINPFPIPGTSQGDFVVLHNQLAGRVYSQAYETLKGGGHITEFEGKKVAEGLARLSRVQSEKEYKAALRELQGILKEGMQRMRQGVVVDDPARDLGQYEVEPDPETGEPEAVDLSTPPENSGLDADTWNLLTEEEKRTWYE